MNKEYDQIICHCVSNDCSKCPMRRKGTSGILAELDFLHGEKPDYTIKEDKNTIEIIYNEK